LKEIREKGNNIPFIMFTGKGREEVAISALNLGADQYLNKTGNPETVYGELAHAIRLAADRKSVQERITESEEKYRNLFENARDVIMTFDLEGNVTSANQAIADYGYKKEELIGESMLKFISKEYWPTLRNDLEQLAQGKPVRNEIAVITPHGKRMTEYTSNPIVRHGDIIGIQTILRDVTDSETLLIVRTQRKA
jgi:PAS domain S-box-containing protein